MNNLINSEKIKKSSFLVTGGCGFIGSHLSNFLVKNSAKKIIILDNLSTGNIENVKEVIQLPNVEFIFGDITNLDTCMNACKGIDFVFHQAALGSVPRSIHDPITTNNVNINGFLNIMHASQKMGIKKVVYAASSSTYGDSEIIPKTENIIGKPLSPYAVTKYVNELYADVFGKLYGLNTIGLRYFNVFGPNQSPNSQYAAVIPLFIQSLIKNKPITINGDGSFSRDFTFIENVIEANMLAMFSECSEALNQVYNIACGESTSLNQLIQTLKNVSKKDVEIIHGPVRTGDIPHSLADITKAKKLLGYSPKVYINQGLELTYLWYNTYFSQNS